LTFVAAEAVLVYAKGKQVLADTLLLTDINDDVNYSVRF
jgi:hypothetical protein